MVVCHYSGEQWVADRIRCVDK